MNIPMTSFYKYEVLCVNPVPTKSCLLKYFFYFFCCLFLTLTSYKYSQAQHAYKEGPLSNDYIIDQWTVEDGLPVNSIYAVQQISDGYLWLATHDGLVRYDGIEFKTYTNAEYPGLKSNRIFYIQGALDGSIILKHEGPHISRFKDGSFTHLLSLDISVSGNAVNSHLYKDSAGTIWLGGDDGIYVYRRDSLERAYPDLVNFPVSNILHHHESELWFSATNNDGVYRILDGVLTKEFSSQTKSWDYINDNFWITIDNKGYRFNKAGKDSIVIPEDFSLFGIYEFEKGEIHLVDTNYDGYSWIDGEIQPYLEDDPQYALQKVLEKKYSTLWYSLNQNEEKILPISGNAPHLFFHEDNEGNMWIGTLLNGLFRVKPKLFKTYTKEDGLPGRGIYPVTQSKDSTIWIGTLGQGFAGIKNGEIEAGYYPNVRKKAGDMQSFLETSDGSFLVSSINFGIQKLDPVTKTTYDIDGWPQGLAYSLYEDSQNRIWAGLNPHKSLGLARFEEGEWIRISDEHDISNPIVQHILETPTGELWFATRGSGVIRFDGSTYTLYSTADGLSSDYPRALHHTFEEHGPVLWVGYEDKGLDRIELKNGSPELSNITNYQTKNGLFDNSVHIIIEDKNRRFWMNSNRGIHRVDIDELNAFHNKQIETIYTRGYTENDGLLNREGNGGVYPAGVLAFDDYIWFPTQDGVVSFHPDSIVANDFIPPVKIQKIQVTDRSPALLNNEITLEPGERDIEISYASLSFTDSQKNQYRYILEGYDDEWRNVGTRRTAYYTNIPSGSYTFRVQGSNNEGIWNTEGASFTVIVTPYFHETPVFYVLVLFFLVIVVISVVHLRNQYFKRREEVLKHQVAIRTKELSEEKVKTESQAKQLQELDEAKSRFFTNITHELRTPLTLIMGPLEQLQNGKAETDSTQRDMMLRNSKRLLHLIDQLLDVTKLENKTVPINPESVLIKPYIRKCVSLFIDAIEGKNIGFTFTSSALTNEVYIDPEKIEKVLGNLLGNALKFTPIGGQISVELDETDTTFLIKISDSGEGIPEEDLPNIFNRFYRVNRTMEEGFGIGLSIAKELVELHNGSIKADSKPGKGTTFTVSLLKGKAHFGADVEINETTKTDHVSEFSTLVLDETFEEEVAEEAEENNDSQLLTHEEDKTTILLVDDNSDMRIHVGSILSENYRVINAKNGIEALKIVEKNPPDLIVADVMMPEMDGITLNRKLKECPIGSSIPFVFLTAKTDTESRISGISDGADFYLTKPFSANELKAVVKNLLSARSRLKKRILSELKIPEVIEKRDKKMADPFIQKLHEVLEQEFSNHEFSVDMLQERMYMSRSSLYRTMNEKAGMNSLKYVTQFRLKKAYQMLMHQEGSISEVAFACGFNSLSYFGRVFKEHFKESPSSFVRNLANHKQPGDSL